MILIIILLILAAIFKAAADTLVHHYSTSIFKNCNPKFWNPEVSWLNKYKNNDVSQGINHLKFQPFSDAWHMVNSSMICCFIALPFIAHVYLHGLLGYAIAGIFYNIVFIIFYKYLFKSK